MRRVLITGASSGIGLALARLFAAQPDTLVFAGCRGHVAPGLQELERALPDRIRVVPLDVTDRAGMESTRDSLIAPAGGLDILINNAGIYPGSV